MTDHKEVYQQEGSQYQMLVSREDYQGNLLPAIQDIVSLNNLKVVDLGTGTGRLANLLAPLAASVQALDISAHMLLVAAERFNAAGYNNCLAAVADHRALPIPTSSIDLIVSGWSLCYLVVWEEENWKGELTKGLSEISRVLRSSGTKMIIETLGTGNEEPEELEKLSEYFDFLRGIGFQETWIRTDYRFESRKEAEDLTTFFFGEEMVGKIHFLDKPLLPECTGIWWLKS